mgnify:CR=1 FL=1
MKYDDEVARQSREVARLLSAPHAHRLDTGRPVRFVGVGTSLHACRVAEYWFRDLTEDRGDVRAEDAHYFALRGFLYPETQVVVVSHRGTKRFTNEVLDRARSLGCETVCITSDSEVMPNADVVLRTCTPDSASTHTVSYTSALAVLAQLVINSLGNAAQPLTTALTDVAGAMSATIEAPEPDADAQQTAEAARILVVGFGPDVITADEGALKIKEGTYKWADSLITEFALHGPPAAYDQTLHAIILEPTVDDGGRTGTLEQVLSRLNATTSTVAVDGSLKCANCHPYASPFVRIIPLQRLVGGVARLLGTSPDTIRTDVEPWKTAMTSFEL